jgi:hypothetical protein
VSDGEYARVYHAIVDDPKFVTVYDVDAALATWLRLLIIADQAWPSSAILPGNAKQRTVKLLADAGLVDLQPGWRYRIHGLDAEREARSEKARNAAAKRWHSESSATASGAEMPSRARARAEQSTTRGQDGLEHIDQQTAELWQRVTAKNVLGSGAFASGLLDDLCFRHSNAKVRGAILTVQPVGQVPSPSQLAALVRNNLEPFPDAKQAKADDSAERERLASRRRSEATYRQNHGLGGHTKQKNPLCPLCQEAA